MIPNPRHMSALRRAYVRWAMGLAVVGVLGVMSAELEGAAVMAENRCYSLQGQGWDRSVPDRLAPFLRLPGTIRLTDTVGTSGPETGKTVVRPLQRLGGDQTWAYWSEEAGALTVRYVNQAATIEMTLSSRPWGWIGVARGRPSVDGFDVRSNVRLESTTCLPT